MDPWEGRSALDAVEVMSAAWNLRREHLPITHRSHYVITNGGGQPNVVPAEAAVWYYLRERTFGGVRTLFEPANEISEAAAKAQGTTVSRRILGYAAPQHGTTPLTAAAWNNITAISMPVCSGTHHARPRAVTQPTRKTNEHPD